jgi:hypothetical protein
LYERSHLSRSHQFYDSVLEFVFQPRGGAAYQADACSQGRALAAM